MQNNVNRGKMKKIAIVHNLPSGGGLRMLNAIILRYNKKSDIDLISLSPQRQEPPPNVKQIHFEVKPWKGFFCYNFWLFFILPFIHKHIAKKINWLRYDTVFVTHDYFTKSPYIVRSINCKKIVYLCQESQREYYEPSSFHAPYIKDKIANILRYPIKRIDQKNVQYVSKILCNSKYSRKNLKNIYKKDCEVIYPGVDCNKFYPSKNKKENIILCVGGINKTKAQDFLLDSIKSILDKYQLVLIGNGREKDLSSIRDMSSSNVKIISGVSDEELVNYYQKSKVTCIAAHLEPFGLSSIESQACGTPVVSVKEGGPLETVINGETGFLSERKKSKYLKSVLMAIKNCKKMEKKCIQNARSRWDWEITLRPLDKYFLKK